MSIPVLLSSFDFKSQIECYQSFSKNLNVALCIYGVLSSAIGLVAAIGLLKLKEVMRKITVGINLLDALIGIPVFLLSLGDLKQYAYKVASTEITDASTKLNIDILSSITFNMVVFMVIMLIGLSISIVYFFTRPKVKEQFE